MKLHVHISVYTIISIVKEVFRMASESANCKIEKYKEIFSLLKKDLKWKVADQRTLMIIASMYVLNGRPFDMKRLIDLSSYIKENVGIFSSLKSYERFTTAAMLDIRFEEPQNKFHELMELYKKMVENGFSRGTFTTIAALVLLSDPLHEKDQLEMIDRSLTVYKGMKKKHLFLTSANDYPLAAMLANRNVPLDNLIEHIEEFYDKLALNGFRKGNDLQFLTHILSLDEKTGADILVQRCVELYDLFKQSGKKPKAMYYPQIGLLALLDDGKSEVKAILHAADQLNSEKLFKWHKDMNLIMAINFIVSNKVTDSSLLETGIYTTIETIIQAQQAAMTAAIVGATAANVSNSAGS